MGIETLAKAAKAAGFAMAGPDEEPDATVSNADRRADAPADTRTNLPALIVKPAPVSTTQWLRGALGMFGRGQPA